MPTLVIKDVQVDERPLTVDESRVQEFEQWLDQELTDALSARNPLSTRWITDLRNYEALPRNPARHQPIEGRMEYEVPLGAIAVDAIYAQELALVTNTTPLVTIRATNARFTEHAKAIQRFADHITGQEDANLKAAQEEALLDKNKLGTGVYYVPWTETWRRTRTSKILRFGPRVVSVPPEDFLVPGGSRDDLQRAPWVAMWLWPTQHELETYAREAGWDIDIATPAMQVSHVRQQREALGGDNATISRQGKFYETPLIWCAYDLNGDGIDEDLLVVFDRSSKRALKIDFNGYDRRPFRAMRYMRRGHMFYGLGIMDMTRANQEIGSDIMNTWLTNAYLANVRMWISSPDVGMGSTIHAWPGRNFQSANPDGMKPLSIMDVYPSMPQLFQTNLFLTERRTGVNQLSQSPVAALGNRTPGITALSALQQQNQRFTAGFESTRVGTAGAVKEMLFRYQERLLMEPLEDVDEKQSATPVTDFIFEVMGDIEGGLVIDTLTDPRFDDGIAVELTASDASINREADRQNALLLANLLGQYYVRTIELMQLAANPQTPPPLRQLAQQVGEKVGELIERTIRTFDQVRDPERFIIDLNGTLQAIDQQTPQDRIAQLLTALGSENGVASSEIPFPGVT